ncbi:MAG TPA: hypothetical protein VFZ10_07685 [Geminicoccaceae bacterium]
MIARPVVLLVTLLVVLPAGAEDQFDEVTEATVVECVEPLRQEVLAPCVLALQRQVLQLQAIVRDRGKRLEALEDAVSVIGGNQMAARALAHCHDWQPECAPLLEKR